MLMIIKLSLLKTLKAQGALDKEMNLSSLYFFISI